MQRIRPAIRGIYAANAAPYGNGGWRALLILLRRRSIAHPIASPTPPPRPRGVSRSPSRAQKQITHTGSPLSTRAPQFLTRYAALTGRWCHSWCRALSWSLPYPTGPPSHVWWYSPHWCLIPLLLLSPHVSAEFLKFRTLLCWMLYIVHPLFNLFNLFFLVWEGFFWVCFLGLCGSLKRGRSFRGCRV